MTMAGDPAIPDESKKTFELLARVSCRPVLYNVVTPIEGDPSVHRNTLAWLDRCRTEVPALLDGVACHAVHEGRA